MPTTAAAAATACCCVPEPPCHVLGYGSTFKFQCCKLPASLLYPRRVQAAVRTEQNVSITPNARKPPHQQLLLLVSGDWFLMRRPQPVFTPFSITTWRVLWWAYFVSYRPGCIEHSRTPISGWLNSHGDCVWGGSDGAEWMRSCPWWYTASLHSYDSRLFILFLFLPWRFRWWFSWQDSNSTGSEK